MISSQCILHTRNISLPIENQLIVLHLRFWQAWELLRRDSLMELVDCTMSLQDDEKLEVHRLINIALLCIRNEAEQRPSMERVDAMLQGRDSESEAVVLKPGNEEQCLESIRFFCCWQEWSWHCEGRKRVIFLEFI